MQRSYNTILGVITVPGDAPAWAHKAGVEAECQFAVLQYMVPMLFKSDEEWDGRIQQLRLFGE